LDTSPASSTLFVRLTQIVGAKGLVFKPREVELETRTCIPFRQIPDCIVYPESAEQVQEIVILANELKVPIWPVSTGKNWGYGEKSACYQGGITMVLEKMREIEFVDEKLGFAIIEPGVTYRDLNRYLKDHGLGLWSDSAGTTESASVIGNALDKGRGLTPYADHFGSLCGMEVVLPDGSLLRTGNTTETRNKVWNLYKWGVGPYLDGLFAQSNLGIVVKAGIWLMPEPEAFDFLAFEYTRSLDFFPEMIDDLRRLVFQGVLRSRPHLANDFAMLCIVSQYPTHLLGGQKSLSPEAIGRWRKEHGVSPWTFGCGLYGSAQEVRNQRRTLRRVLGRYGRLWSFGLATRSDWIGKLVFQTSRYAARLAGKSPAFLDSIKPAADLFKGIPTDEFARQVYFKSHRDKPSGAFDPAKDQCGFIWIGPVVPFLSKDVQEVLEKAGRVFRKHDFDVFVEIIVESPRALIVLFGVFYDKADTDEVGRASNWYTEIRLLMIESGYPPYRETALSSPHAFEYNPTTRNFLATIKKAIDPVDTLAPGRYGITSFTRTGPRPLS
jgi:4-cresol dehydrogenase (hydroxylating) flavoprotein subunit